MSICRPPLAVFVVLFSASPLFGEEPTQADLLARAGEHEEAGEYREALVDYDAAEKLGAVSAEFYRRRGIARFFNADIRGSVADFDRNLELRPADAPYDWMRGISLYYLGAFGKGRAQFESHQNVNSSDVENAAWHFLCVARLEGAKKARAALIPIKGDARVPMKEVHDLFAGTGTREDVLKAAETGPDSARRNQLCYAHLYLALYEEALANKEKSLEHIRLAAGKYGMPHYMGQVARVHRQLREEK